MKKKAYYVQKRLLLFFGRCKRSQKYIYYKYATFSFLIIEKKKILIKQKSYLISKFLDNFKILLNKNIKNIMNFESNRIEPNGIRFCHGEPE